MGCAHSVEKEETVQRCRERKRFMKQLLSCRAEYAAAHLAYLQSLRNTGATIRQFMEIETLDEPPSIGLPPFPPPSPPLPPLPPQPFHFNFKKKDAEKEDKGKSVSVDVEDYDEDDNDSLVLPPPPPPPLDGANWDFGDPFSLPTSPLLSSPIPPKHNDGTEAHIETEDEDWAETYSEFEEYKPDEVHEENGQNSKVVRGKMLVLNPVRELLDDNSSAFSGITKESDVAAVVWRSKKTLAGIMKELDEYFLKAAAAGKDVAVLLDSHCGPRLDWTREKRNGSTKSAKVFSALSWSWSSKSLNSSRDGCLEGADDSLNNHSSTLEKIYAEEQKLYKEVKEEEMVRSQHDKKLLTLHRLETRDHDLLTAEKLWSNVEYLQARIISLQESINDTCLSISSLRDVLLYPQLVELSLGLLQMWRTMYECHLVQNHISQQANLLDSHPGFEPTSDSHHKATIQLETEVNSWYNSFCNLLTYQREYILVLNQWVRLTDCLPDNTGTTSGIQGLCQELHLALDRLPEKVAAEAIKSFLSVVHSIVLQQVEESNLKRRSDCFKAKLERELSSFHELENIFENATDQTNHPVTAKRAKLNNLKRKAEEERTKYLTAIRITQSMTHDKLQRSLPNVFQALMGFANVCIQSLEGIAGQQEL